MKAWLLDLNRILLRGFNNEYEYSEWLMNKK